MSETPLDIYYLTYKELFTYLFWETAILVAAVYTVLGLFMFIASRNIKLIFLPFLYAIFGCITGIINSVILSAILPTVYLSVPYLVTKKRIFYLSIMQALIICYSKFSRNNRISPILIV